jgi:protease IV
MRGMNKTFQAGVIMMLVMVFTSLAIADAPYNYYQFRSNNLVPLPYGPVAMPGATSGLWTNPAGIGVDGSSGFIFSKPSSADGYSDFLSNDLAWGANIGGLGFGMQYVNGSGMDIRRYTLSTSHEIMEGFHFGTAYHWSKGLDLQNAWDASVLIRPTRWVSFGATATELIGGDYGVPGQVGKTDADPTYRTGLAVRPFGPMLTLTGDVTFSKVGIDGSAVDYMEDLDPTFTASIMPYDGITLRGGYAVDSEMVFGGISISLGMSEVGGWSGFVNESSPNRPDDAGATWVRTSSHWQPTFWEPMTPKKIVKMKLSGYMAEEEAPFSFFYGRNPTMIAKIGQLDQIARDKNVAGVWLDVQGLSAQFADMEELREALQRVQRSGKKVVVYSDGFGTGSYYLASVADEIIMLPTGSIFMPGLRAEMMYFRQLADKYHVEPQVEKIDEYKGAFEAFTEQEMSKYTREALNALLDSLWDEYLTSISASRNMSRPEVQAWVDGALHSGRAAVELGLVDQVAYSDEAAELVKEAIVGDKKSQVVSAGHYFSVLETDSEWEDMTSPKIAVILAEGPIYTGKSGRSGWGNDPHIGAETVAAAIRRARNDYRVKAIVMRVDSPGGSAEASDIIAREVMLTVNPEDEDAETKPFIVSMSGVAASGGYYIACLADTIVASRSTITGSIGVLATNFAYEDALDSLGITMDRIMRGENADIFAANGWDAAQRAIIRKEIEIVYDDFTTLVAEGRGMTQEDVNEIGRGRVWAGDDAIERNLVDIEGGLYESLQVAKETLGMDRNDLVDLKIYTANTMWMPGNEMFGAASKVLPESVIEILAAEEEVSRMNSGDVQMLAPISADDVILD